MSSVLRIFNNASTWHNPPHWLPDIICLMGLADSCSICRACWVPPLLFIKYCGYFYKNSAFWKQKIIKHEKVDAVKNCENMWKVVNNFRKLRKRYKCNAFRRSLNEIKSWGNVKAIHNIFPLLKLLLQLLNVVSQCSVKMHVPMCHNYLFTNPINPASQLINRCQTMK